MSGEQASRKGPGARKSIHNKSGECNEKINNSRNQCNYSRDNSSDDNSSKHSSSEYSEDENDNPQDTLTEENPVNNQTNLFVYFIASFFIITSLSGVYTAYYKENNYTITISMLRADFPSQKETVWNNIIVAINDVKEFNRPSVLLFIYKLTDEAYIDKFIRNISIYASEKINEELLEPINVPISELTSNKAKEDYGYIIEKYRNELKEKAVMVVKHMEEIPGSVAQAFHSLCDEISPLIEKSLFILTVKVDAEGKTEVQKAENTLRKKWAELDNDIFDPLFTRISGAVIEIEK